MQADDASPGACYGVADISWHLVIRSGGRRPDAGLKAFELLVQFLHREQIASGIGDESDIP